MANRQRRWAADPMHSRRQSRGDHARKDRREKPRQSKDVKQFAEKMVRDHEQFGQQLEKFAREGERPVARTDIRNPAGGPAAATTSATGQPMEGRGIDLFAIHEEVGKKCLEMFEADLKQKDGSQFDKCYVAQQIGGHVHMIAELEVLRSHVSPELAAVLDKGIATAKSHLEEAQKLAQVTGAILTSGSGM